VINKQIYTPEKLNEYKKSFSTAKPYKHLVIDNFLDTEFAETLYQNFPGLDLMTRSYNGLNERKSEGSYFDKYHKSFTNLRNALHSSEFCKWLSSVTGIDDLYSVEDGLGCGVHQGSNGSYLDIHIDFNIHYDRNIHRRVNVLVFLNKDWKESYGGLVEMWNADVSKLEQAYLPSFNRCVIFETNEISYHGYGKIEVPEGVTRKSIYSYYYTDLREDAVKYHDTIFKARPEEGLSKKIKTDVKETLKNNIKRVFKSLGIKI
jgi:Rps23 Pro-64 3,4-dihydroxylase Tpa1-like proline 4-hydroxylase